MLKRFLATLLLATGCASAFAANLAPTVAMTGPAANASFIGPAAVTLSAIAADSDGTVSKVVFYKGAVVLATVTTAPYTYNWTNVAAGSYIITAKATDNAAAVTTSAPLTVTVAANALPTVSIVNSPANAALIGPAAVVLSASASDSDGSIAKVQYYNGATLVGSATTAPYAINWNNVAAGTYSLTAKATDDKGGVATAAATTIVVNANALPSVAMTAPIDNSTYVAPAAIAMSASASDTDGSISSVQYFNGATALTTSTIAPYAVNWTNVAAGTYTVTAKATDNKGGVTTSAPVTVVVKANVAPSVSLTTPLANATYAAPGRIVLTAAVADGDGSVAKVNFYNGSTVIATLTAAPYTYSWNNVPIGSYSLTAKATDDKGAATTSAAIAVTVNANVAPTVSVSAPLAGASFAAPATIALKADASDADGSVSKVAFYNGSTLIGTATALPFAVSWANVAIGNYTITAKATDDKGAVTTSAVVAVSVKANVAPTVNITAPSNNAIYGSSATVTLSANAADSDGTISKVDFYNGTLLVGSATAAPFSVNMTNVVAGNYSITARASDDKGAVTTSLPIVFVVKPNVAPTVSLTGPANNASFIVPTVINVSANAGDSDGSVSKVEFYSDATLIGTATAAPYTINWANAGAGTYAVTARATDNDGTTTVSAPVTVTVLNNSAPQVTLTATPTAALAPALINLSATARDSDGSIAKVEFFNGASLLATVSQAPFTFAWSNVNAGTYTLTAKATDNLGLATVSAPVSVEISAGGSSQVFYVQSDQINTPRLITNAVGQAVWQIDQEPFGAHPPNENPSGQGIFTYNGRFPGQYFDRETGLHYNYYRDYDPQTGRYVQSDPIGLGGGINTYGYVGGNPLSRSDPLGLRCTSDGKFFSCDYTGGPSFGPLPAPAGWPKTIDENTKYYHHYVKRSPAGKCARPADLWNKLVHNPTPGFPDPASKAGTPNEATPPWIQYGALGPLAGPFQTGLNPVISYITIDHKTGHQIVVNVTQPGHQLFPGYTARDISMATFGEGAGALQSDADVTKFQRDLINNVWKDIQSKSIKDAEKDCGCP